MTADLVMPIVLALPEVERKKLLLAFQNSVDTEVKKPNSRDKQIDELANRAALKVLTKRKKNAHKNK